MRSRKEARIERQNAKKLKALDKSARLVEHVATDKFPRVAHAVDLEPSPREGVSVPPDIGPRVGADPESIMSLPMRFVMHEYADRRDAWSWGQERNWCAQRSEESCEIRSFLLQMSALKWAEVLAQETGAGRRRARRRKHHPQSFGSICDEAQTRWIEIGRFEDELFRFRCSGRSRIWGVRQGSTFYVVWWDPQHQIYPVD